MSLDAVIIVIAGFIKAKTSTVAVSDSDVHIWFILFDPFGYIHRNKENRSSVLSYAHVNLTLGT